MLRSGGYAVKTASGALEALRLLRESDGAFDLIVTDVVMPDMSGLTLGQQVIETWRLPVLYLTGFVVEEEDRAKLPLDHMLLKPIRRSTLLKKVWEMLHPPAAASPPRTG